MLDELKKIWLAVIVIVIMLAIIVVGIFLLQQRDTNKLMSANQELERRIATIQNSIEQLSKKDINKKEDQSNVIEENIDDSAVIESINNTLKEIVRINNQEEKLESLLVPSNWQEEIYLTTLEYSTSVEFPSSPSSDLFTNRVYKYNIKTDKLIKLFEKDLSDYGTLGIIGKDNGKLVFWYTAWDDSPGPCFSPWVHSENLKYLDLSNLDQNLQDYIVPNYKYQDEFKRSAECEKNL